MAGGVFIKKLLLLWFLFGGSGVPEWHPFWSILEVLGVQMVPILLHFGGLVASFGAWGAQFAPGPPGVFHGCPLFNDFSSQKEPKGVPKWIQNQ